MRCAINDSVDPVAELRKALEEVCVKVDASYVIHRFREDRNEAERQAEVAQQHFAEVVQEHLPAVLQRLADAEAERDELRARVKYTH